MQTAGFGLATETGSCHMSIPSLLQEVMFEAIATTQQMVDVEPMNSWGLQT